MADRLLVATRKGLFTIDRVGGAWKIASAQFIGDRLSLVLPDKRDGRVYAAFDHGHFGVKMQRSDDGGATWHETPAPQYPELPEGAEPVLDPNGKPMPQTLKLIWSLEPGGPGEPGRIWCGTIPGGLFKSDDHGDSWQLVTSLWDHPKRKEWFGGGADWPGIHSICVDPRDAAKLAVGVSCGGVWMSGDGGASWNCRADGMHADYMPPGHAGDPNIQDAHRLVQCPAAPQSFWVQHHNGIFRTTDGCQSWRPVTGQGAGRPPSTFGFAVAVHPDDGDTAWFVPAIKDERRVPVDGRVVVTRTRDGGETFAILSRGLPQQHAYDLVFRHGLDIDETGDRLAFGSTTGSLWVSEDQGDAWQCVAANLPPIYCVRFAQQA